MTQIFWLLLGVFAAMFLLLHVKSSRKASILLGLLKMDTAELEGLLADSVSDESSQGGSADRLRVVIEIIDPIAVARKESRLGRAFEGVMPNYIRKQVYRRVRNEVAQVMESRGIDARVTVSRGFSIDA